MPAKINHTVMFLLMLWIIGCAPESTVTEERAGVKDQCPEGCIENVVVYDEKGKFCGWPANEGMWSWGDEMLVGFEISGYKKTEKGHSIDRESPKYIYFARSTDGGQSWSVEKPEEILPPAYLEDPDKFKQGPDVVKTLTKRVRFGHHNFAMKFRSNRYYYSYDRGDSWTGPFELPNFGQKLIMARTDYIVLGEYKCLAFISSSPTDGKYGKTFGILTEDGGLSWKIQGWVTDKFPPLEYKRFSFSIMPSTVRISENTLVTSLRQRFEGGKWIDIYRSDDLGKNWTHLTKAVDRVNNPPSLVKLPDDRLVLIYCYRLKPYGLRAKISKDNGQTWSDEIILRDDGLSWDIGYVQSKVRSDGKIVSVYYYHTKQKPRQHIAATIWQP